MSQEYQVLQERNEFYREQVKGIKHLFHIWSKLILIMECLKQFLDSPATQLNDLNTVIPAIIDKNNV